MQICSRTYMPGPLMSVIYRKRKNMFINGANNVHIFYHVSAQLIVSTMHNIFSVM